MHTSLLRLPEVLSRLGRSRSTLYDQIERGLFPEPIKVGRNSCWRNDEVDALVDGYTAGLDETKLLALCRSIAERRGQVAEHVGRLPALSS